MGGGEGKGSEGGSEGESPRNVHGAEVTFKKKESTTFIICKIQHNSQFLKNQSSSPTQLSEVSIICSKPLTIAK